MTALLVDQSHIESQAIVTSTTLRSVSVVIPFTKPERVGNAIESVLAQDYPQGLVEIIVVGEGSQVLKEKWPLITAIDVGRIYEPGRARNLGAAETSGEVLLFLDDDCEAQKGWIVENLAELENTEVGAVSGMIAGKSRAYFAQGVDFANFSLCQTHGRRERTICTASFAIRQEVFLKVGGFDETLKVHEDIDICHRINMAGHTTVYQPKVKVLHNHAKNTLSSLVRYLYFGGYEGGLKIEERFKDQSAFYRLLLGFRHPLVYFLLLLPFAFVATLQTIAFNVREHKRVLLLSPAIFLGKLSCHIGIWSSLRRGKSQDAGYLREMRRLLSYALFKHRLKTPRVLTLFVTSRCNAHCGHCFYWENTAEKAELSIREIDALSRSLGKIDILLISGGEPFLRADLPEICAMFIERNGVEAINIPTNGLQPKTINKTMRKIMAISRGRSIHLSISIDGMEQIHDEIRGVPGTFRRARETYQTLLHLRSEFPALSLRINSTVFNRNYASLQELFKEYEKYFPGVDVPTLSLLRGNPRDESARLPEEMILRQLFEHKQACAKGNQTPASKFLERMLHEIALESLNRQLQVLPCEAGRIVGVVDANGDIRHCELLPPIGNLHDGLFEELWNSPPARLQRQSIANGNCYCTHECFLYPSLLAHPFMAVRMGWKTHARKLYR